MAIEKRGEQSVARRGTSPYMPDFDESDFAPPEWRLVQPTSQAHTQQGISLGSYYCDQTGEAAEHLDVAILKVQRNRTYWVGGDLNFPACSSDDRVMPRPGGMHKGPCAGCEANGAGCSPGYNLLCVRLDQQGQPEPSEMFLLRVNGTSVFPFRKLWSRIHLNHQDNPWSIIVALTSEKKSNDKGTYWVMVPNIAQEFTYEADLAMLKSLADGMAAPLEEQRKAIETEAAQQHRGAPAVRESHYGPGRTTIAGPAAPGEARPARAPRPQPRLITEQEGQEIVAQAERLGVPGETITPFLQSTFNKTRLMQLHVGELAMLTKWLEQEFGQTVEDALEIGLDGEPIDSLPF